MNRMRSSECSVNACDRGMRPFKSSLESTQNFFRGSVYPFRRKIHSSHSVRCSPLTLVAGRCRRGLRGVSCRDAPLCCRCLARVRWHRAPAPGVRSPASRASAQPPRESALPPRQTSSTSTQRLPASPRPEILSESHAHGGSLSR